MHILVPIWAVDLKVAIVVLIGIVLSIGIVVVVKYLIDH